MGSLGTHPGLAEARPAPSQEGMIENNKAGDMKMRMKREIVMALLALILAVGWGVAVM